MVECLQKRKQVMMERVGKLFNLFELFIRHKGSFYFYCCCWRKYLLLQFAEVDMSYVG